MTLVQTEPKKITIRKASRLPAEYQEVEWIGTTGTQWIDTGLFAGDNIQTEAKVEVSTTTQNIPVFGSYTAINDGSIPYWYYHLTAYSNSWYYGINGTEGHAGTYNNTVGTIYEIVYNDENNKLVVNNSVLSDITGTTGWTGTTLAISYRGRQGVYDAGQWKYYSFKMYNKTTGQYVRNFVPCYRKADGVIGMYDLVNSQFYTNSGTGTFNKGNNTNGGEIEIKKIYIYPDGVTEKQIRPAVPSTQTITISATMGNGSIHDYALNLAAKPTNIKITYTSVHASGWSDSLVGISASNPGTSPNDNWYRWYCGSGSLFGYASTNRLDRGTQSSYTQLLRNEYQATGTWQTVVNLGLTSCSVQQGTAAEISTTITDASILAGIDTLFSNYTNLKLITFGTNDTFTSDVVLEITY